MMQATADILRALLRSRPVTIGRGSARRRSDTLIILGNGPSLRDTIAAHTPLLQQADTLAVNFFANTPEHRLLRPHWYLLADPHFFAGTDPNVEALWRNLATTPESTLLLPSGRKPPVDIPNRLTYNATGLFSDAATSRLLMRRRLGMPRPRNVLIPAIMCGIWLGYSRIYLTGADHSWLQTLSVDDSNRVVTLQPHFYADNSAERTRVSQVYADIRLHQILDSMRIAFATYHRLASLARRCGVQILNATPGSMIDAFPRQPLPTHN